MSATRTTMPVPNLNGIPGCSPERLSELWRGVLHVTQDSEALCEFKLFAAGGLGVSITWKQGGRRCDYTAQITKAELDAVGVDRATIFPGFMTETLEAVRKKRNTIAGWTEEEAPSAPRLATNVENAVAMMVGTARARTDSPPPDTAQPEEKTDGKD